MLRLLAANYFISNGYSPHSTFTSSTNLLLVTAFAAITALTENVSSEISNYIEYDSPAKEDNLSLDSQPKQVAKKTEIAASSIKSNDSKSDDSETSRRSRYLRTMPPSMMAGMPGMYGFERRSSAAAAAAAAAAADEDLRKYGRILKYHAVPFDGRKPAPMRRPYGIKSRYRPPYLKDKVRMPSAISANHYKNKWQMKLPNDASFSPYRGYGGDDHGNGEDNEDDDGGVDAVDEAGGDYAAFSSDDLSPYDDYYEDGQSAAMSYDGDYKKRDNRKENAWYSKNYRDKLEKEREPAVAYEDVEPALSLEHAVGKRFPFAKYSGAGSGGNFEMYTPFKKYKFPRGRGEGEPNPEPMTMDWLNSGAGEKRANAAMLSMYRRPQRPSSSTWPALSQYNNLYKSATAKYSPFETEDSSHRFKLDNSPRYLSDGNNEIEKRERENALKAHLYRRRQKQRDHGRFWPSSGSSSSSLNEDELTTGSRYESGVATADVGNDRENAISTSPSKRPSLPVQEEDVVVYSSRYRNKQAAAVAAAQRVLDTHDDDSTAPDSGTNRIDPSRLVFDYHDRGTISTDAMSSPKQRKKFATLDRVRKSNRNRPEGDVEVDAPPPSNVSEMEDDVTINESHSPSSWKSNYMVSSPFAASLFSSSTPSTVFPAYNRKSGNRRSPTSTTTKPTGTEDTAAVKTSITTTTPAAATELLSDPDLEFDSASTSNSNRNGNDARYEVESDGGGADRISASELIAYMSARPSEPVVHKQDRFANANEAFVFGGYSGYGYGYPFVRTFSEQSEKLASNYHKSPSQSAANDQDFEINLDQYGYRRRKKRRRRR